VREIVIPHSEISDSQTITQKNIEYFKKNDLDIHRHEVTELIDDKKAGVRILKVKNTKYFMVPDLPWLTKKLNEDENANHSD
jgi:patatin-like phospholipase/acyl hydrolase